MEKLSLELWQIIFGTFFLIVGLLSASIALLRRGQDIKVLIWLAAWSGSFGIRALIETTSVKTILPQFLQNFIQATDAIISYLILVFAFITWLYLVRGKVRVIIKVMIVVSFVLAVLGIVYFFVTGNSQTFMPLNSLLATFALIFISALLLLQKKYSNKFFIFQKREVLLVGSVLFIGEALYTNLSNIFGYESYPITAWFGFAILILALGYTAANMIIANEHKLITIENEMETARQIQASILPERIPKLSGIGVDFAYHPMTAVAGDFYDFIKIDQNKIGFFIADVSGHGVPAALIASMLKVAMLSVVEIAQNPGVVLKRLSKILGGQLREQFVTAAYLYIDLESCQARYSAAGHPPLIYWNSNTRQVSFIESNGLILSSSMQSEYPVRNINFESGDLFLLYTDGVIEAKNQNGEDFGNKRLEVLIPKNTYTSLSEFSSNILNALNLWQNNKMPQQDDITWIAIDIL
jgi:sigma-B regulation protein RsbU (phosphoserine phosphatase)